MNSYCGCKWLLHHCVCVYIYIYCFIQSIPSTNHYVLVSITVVQCLEVSSRSPGPLKERLRVLHSELHERIQREETNRVGMLGRLRDVFKKILLGTVGQTFLPDGIA